MKILIVTDAWAPQVNGVVRTLTTLRDELVRLGNEVHMLTPAQFNSLPCPTYPEIRLALTTPWRLGRLIQTLKPEAIHIATEGPLGWAARRVCLKYNLPFTTGYHTRFPEYIAARFSIPLRLSYAVVRAFHAPSAGVLVPTQTLLQDLSAKGFTNLRLWGRGVDTTLFQPSASTTLNYPRPILLNVGRLAIEKNLEAFLSLPTPGTHVVVGDGPQKASLQKKYPHAVFLGPLFGAALAEVYSQADVFVFPSKTDTFGLVMLEALACGTPVAAYPVMGPIDVLTDPRAGCMDADLATAVQQALKLARADCRAFALTQSWASIAKLFYDYLKPLPVTQ